MMHSKIYSYILVIIQFPCIVSLVLLSPSLVNNFWALGFVALGFCFGFYTIFPNRSQNFNIIPDIKEGATLIRKGAYAYVRHPMYFSVLIIMSGMLIEGLSALKISIFLVMVSVLVLKAKKEEYLWIKQSTEYLDYMKKTKMIVPFIF